ncbi:MAG TPA: hypothetical protein VFT53_04625 [Candidatus Saccharimonadales bacterium]|nr:hypothetical protein [Candidatus Saccharimonadales bacterium]
MSYEQYPTPSMQGSTELPYSVWEQLLGPGVNLDGRASSVGSTGQLMQPYERITGPPMVDVRGVLAAQQHTAPLRATIVQDGRYRTGFGEEARWEYAPPKTDALVAWNVQPHGYRPSDIAYGLDTSEGAVCVADFSADVPDQEIHFSPVKPGTIKSEAAVLRRAHEVALEGLLAASRKYRAALDAHDRAAMEEARDDRDYHAACAQKLARGWQMLEATPMHVTDRRRSAGYLSEEGARYLDRPEQYRLPDDEDGDISPAAKRNFKRLGSMLLRV